MNSIGRRHKSRHSRSISRRTLPGQCLRTKPPVEIITIDRPATNPEVLLRTLDAIRKRMEVDVEYASLSGSASKARVIALHALAYSAGRWYVRAWSRDHNDFRDYNLSRIQRVGDHRASTIDPALDFEWAHQINLVIVPNPDLSPDHRAAIAAEHAMEAGKLVRPCRLSVSFYLMNEFNLDVEPGVLKPQKQQLILENRDEVLRARAAARQMSIEAIARAAQTGKEA